MRKLKKLSVLFLLTAFIGMYALPINYAYSKAPAPKNSLKEFIQEAGDNIEAGYQYPSYNPQLHEDISEKIKIPAHTPVIIRATKTISSEQIQSGDIIYFKTVENVKDRAGNILIAANSPVQTEVFFQKSKMIGKAGKLSISDFHTKAVDGTYVPLSASISIEAEDKSDMSLLLGLLICPLFLLMKGEEAVLHAGATRTVYTAGDVYIRLQSEL